MSRSHVVDATVKLTTDEIGSLIQNHISIVEALATKFDGQYLDMGVRVSDYRGFLDEIGKNLGRAEELIKIIDGGGK